MDTSSNNGGSPLHPTPSYGIGQVLDLWFGVTQPVKPTAYMVSGVVLCVFKYAVEALSTWQFTGMFLAPWYFINPLWSVRVEIFQNAPPWFSWALFAWTLPFLWIAVSMSVRRAADAGSSPWLGMLVLIPLVNLVFMATMCVVASDPDISWSIHYRSASEADLAKRAALAVGLSLLVGGLMLLISVFLFSTYGSSLFLGTPMLMGTTASYIYNRPVSRTYRSSMIVGMASVTFAALALLLFALEGIICIAMAIPLILPIGIMGGALGKAIADATQRPSRELMAAVLLLPLLAGGESLIPNSREFVVLSSVEIDAPPETVWRNVIEFPELPKAREWYFRLGIACPERARIVGRGVGATRYCEFTTGTFVEPVTTWDEPRRLAFNVSDQPEPMIELSPYRNIHPPHLHHYLESRRGEFQLIPLPGGRTRLEGRTWYTFKMFPQGYWTLWSDAVIHRIHERVLLHIKDLSERTTPPARGGLAHQ